MCYKPSFKVLIRAYLHNDKDNDDDDGGSDDGTPSSLC